MTFQLGSRQHRRYTAMIVVQSLLIVLVLLDLSVRLGRVYFNQEHERLGIFNKASSASTADSHAKDCRLEDSSPGVTFISIEARADMGTVGNPVRDAMIPLGGGYLFQRANDSEPQPRPYGVSMFHGLHCLHIIRSKLQELLVRTGESDIPQPSHLDGHDDSQPVKANHYTHCLEYIAQVGIAPVPASDPWPYTGPQCRAVQCS